MAQIISTIGTNSDTCNIMLLQESRLDIQSVCTQEKCRLASSILKPDYASKKHLPFLDLVDIGLLSILTSGQLKSKIENIHFSDKEQTFLLESRRRWKNRMSAIKSRKRHDIDIMQLTKEQADLRKKRNDLLREKQILTKEIESYSALMCKLATPSF
ncbi:hypothetical protein LOD99_2483 [Oopsacas minuta]|uniref:BZIP domain-containing protein n=1 Tax=Oopsacas minuta TaxID=111878 RepID=A0AAV7K3B2_9METZ|nr:hypothetical protein LOD99_2483 [Oopsacas minuta]